MPEDMDINAGTIIDGEQTLEQVGEEIFERMIAVASGEKTASERFGMGMRNTSRGPSEQQAD